MQRLILLLAVFACGCAGKFDAVPNHAFPAHVTRGQADYLYDANALSCDDGECTRADGKRPLGAYSENGYEEAQDVLKSRRRSRLVGMLVPGCTGAAAVLLGLAFNSMANQQEKDALAFAEFGSDPTTGLEKAADYRTFSTAMFVVGPVLIATGAIIGLAIPNADEEFAEEYNRALRRDLDRRTRGVGEPITLAGPRR